MKKIEICPMILDTKLVQILPMTILKEFVELSNPSIVAYVEKFMTKYMDTSDKELQEIIEKLKEAYSSYYSYKAFVDSAELADAFKLIVTTERNNISYDMEKSDLHNIVDTITKVLQYEDKLKRYDEKSLNLHIDRMKNLASVESNEVANATKTLIDNIRNFQSIFINAKGREDDKTILYRIFRFKDKALQLKHTAEDCLQRMESSTNAEEKPFDKRKWRHI